MLRSLTTFGFSLINQGGYDEAIERCERAVAIL